MMRLGAFCINLDKDVEKRACFLRKYTLPSNFEFSFESAIYGAELPAAIFQSFMYQRLLRLNKMLSVGELGCKMSHANAIRNSFVTGFDVTLVAEDDAIFPENSDPMISKFANFLCTVGGVLILGGQEGLPSSKYLKSSPVVETFHFGGSDYQVRKLSKFGRIHVKRTCAYLVEKNSLVELERFFRESPFLADEWDRLGGSVQLYFVEFVQHPLLLDQSNIEIERAVWSNRDVSGFFSVGFLSILKKVFKGILFRSWFVWDSWRHQK